MEYATSPDHRIFVRIERSGGTPGVDQSSGLPAGTPEQLELSGVVLLDQPPPANHSFTGRAVASVFARWFAHRVIFRGGWTVHVDAPDQDPIKIRCPNRDAAAALAHRLVGELQSRGPAAITS